MSVSQNKELEILEKLKKIVRDSSLSRISAYSQYGEFNISENPNPNKSVLAHWMVMVLISGGGTRITFKAHFMSDNIKKLAAKVYKCATTELSLDQYSDFVKEFCNLTAGNIKRMFEMNNMHVGISLPLITRGFDEIFFSMNESSSVANDIWRLECQDVYLDCTSIIEVFDYDSFSDLNILSVNDSGEEEIEFL